MGVNTTPPMEITFGRTVHDKFYFQAAINIGGTLFPLFDVRKETGHIDTVEHEDFDVFTLAVDELLRKIWQYYVIEKHELKTQWS
jgi:hypothetical protein